MIVHTDKTLGDSTTNQTLINDFLAGLPDMRRKLVDAMVNHASADNFVIQIEFIDDQGIEENGIHGFYTFADRVAFYHSHKELFKAVIKEEADSLRYLSVLDWYIRLDYPTYQLGKNEGFELTNELMTAVFIDFDTQNIEHDRMADALVRELLFETARQFVAFKNQA